MYRDYDWVAETVREKINTEDDLERQMQVAVDVLWEQLHDKGVSWVGFYFKVPDVEEMVLGPMRDKAACSPIGMQGACGKSFLQKEPVVVQNVKDLGEHYIACDPRDQSEIVLPVYSQTGRIMGVLDLDSHEEGAFDYSDVEGLRKVLKCAGLLPLED